MQLTGLRHLHLHDVRSDESVPLSPGGTVLSSLQQLTYLNVTDCRECFFTPAALKHLTALTRLQHLGLGDDMWVYVWYEPPPLPGPKDWLFCLTRLTALELTQHKCRVPAPGFAALPKLRRLRLRFSRIDLSALAAVSSLQHLRMYYCSFGPYGSDADDDGWQQQLPAAQAVFFSWLQLQPLTHLSIQYCQDNGLDPKGAAALAQARAVVTASTALRELHYPWLFLEFPAQHKQLLQLTALTCSCGSDGANSANSVKQLVRCCPAVKQLELATWVQPDLLLPLTGLTSLSLHGLEDDKVPQLLTLTRLQALSLTYASISDQGLQEPSALRQLTRLDVHSTRFSKSMRAAISSPDHVIIRKAGFGPPVWQQVLRYCEKAGGLPTKGQQKLLQRQQQMQGVGLPLNPGDAHGYHLRPKQCKSYRE